MNTKKTSKSRKRLIELSEQLSSLLSEVIETRAMTKGTICDLRRKCGKKKCKCARGELHSTKVLGFSHNGKTRLLCLTKYPALYLSRIERYVRNYRIFRRRRSKIVSCFKLFISEMNKLEKNLLVEVPPKKGEKNGRQKKRK